MIEVVLHLSYNYIQWSRPPQFRHYTDSISARIKQNFHIIGHESMVPLFRIPESVLHNMRSRCTSFVPLSLLLAPYIQLVNAVAKNYTIGDTIGDHRTGQKVLYQPRKLWGTQACQNCSILPDVARIGAGTYHEATSAVDPSHLSITMNFSGELVHHLSAPP